VGDVSFGRFRFGARAPNPNRIVRQRITAPPGTRKRAADLVLAAAHAFSGRPARRRTVVDPHAVYDLAHTAHLVGDVLGQVLHAALRHLAGQGHHAILDDQQDLGRIQGLMLRHAVDQLVDDARVGAGVVARASPAVAHATGMPTGVGILRPAASVPALRVPALVLAVAALVEVGVGELVGEVAPTALAFVTERVVLARRRTPAAVGRRWHVAVLPLA